MAHSERFSDLHAGISLAVYTAYNESQGSRDKLCSNWDNVVTEYTISMTKAHSELTKGDRTSFLSGS